MIILGKNIWDSQDCTENPCLGKKKKPTEKFKDSIFVITNISQIYETKTMLGILFSIIYSMF